MRKDELQVRYLSERFPDLINGLVFKGKQVVTDDDVIELDTQTGIWKSPSKQRNRNLKHHTKNNNSTQKGQRDILRKMIFGAGFAIIGIENQEEVHYLMPLRVMEYDAAEYAKQVSHLNKNICYEKGVTSAEFLSKFKKDMKLLPCITFVLFYGKNWDGSNDLCELLDFSGLPDELSAYVSNYKINLIEIRKFENTDVFKTDLKLVFDFIKYSDDKQKLKELVNSNEAYTHMNEDAYAMAAVYGNVADINTIENYIENGGEFNMCKAFEDYKLEGIEIGKQRGIEISRNAIINLLQTKGNIPEDICKVINNQSDLNILEQWLNVAIYSADLVDWMSQISL